MARTEVISKEQRHQAPLRTPLAKGTCTKMTGPQNVWLRKSAGLSSGKSHGLQETDSTLKGLVHYITQSKAQQSSSSLKSSSLYVKIN